MTHPSPSGLEPDHLALPGPRGTSESFRPVLLDPSRPAGAAALAELRDSNRLHEVHDRIEDQVEELLGCVAPHDPFGGRSRSRAVADTVGPHPDAYGRWAWYPWSGRLVHVLPEAEFRLVRTDRNRDKITREQQRGLLGRRIGVIGLSVGSSAALTCAMEGVGGAFRLADSDRLGLSNLNRLRAGVHEIGREKSVLCARRMYELDPYLDIEVHRGGIDEENIEDFFGGEGGGHGLDLLIEEADAPWVKVASREHARSLRIPVLMDTNDRGVLDVERFDLEPDRPLFHGRVGATTAADVRDLGRDEALGFLLDVVDEQRLSPAMRDALTRVGHTLSSWPQLASGVMLGAALVTDTARRILLGEPLPSGRHSIDLETLVPAPAAVPVRHGAGR
ncbi:ThiF family adenylyltransferase [Streptomyces subrutilus]|uniref:ThiF family adenylyltransferase n=1 Tax=Streptomyces subrutilus TaxID=36818 RepID=UPI002E0E844A|nr:ThiF family adenylyltransferase [Streptomyces subrutilus]